MSIEIAEKLKSQLTDKYVVVKQGVPELRRFATLTGRVKTVNMSGRALVEFNGPVDIGWYDIDPEYLTVVEAPVAKAAPGKHAAPAKVAEAAKPAAAAAKPAAAAGAKPAGKSPLEMARAKGQAPPQHRLPSRPRPLPPVVRLPRPRSSRPWKWPASKAQSATPAPHRHPQSRPLQRPHRHLPRLQRPRHLLPARNCHRWKWLACRVPGRPAVPPHLPQQPRLSKPPPRPLRLRRQLPSRHRPPPPRRPGKNSRR